MSYSTTLNLQRCLKRLGQSDIAARTELLNYAKRRLKLLANRMFLRFPQLYSREESDDLFQEAMIRLWQSLEAVNPTTVAGFMGLAALQMRRALCDLARNHFGRNDESEFAISQQRTRGELVSLSRIGGTPIDDRRNAPEELAYWSDFHAAAGQLPEPVRTAFDLLFYHELPQNEAAQLMDVSVRQIQRYWHSARLTLSKSMEGSWPEL